MSVQEEMRTLVTVGGYSYSESGNMAFLSGPKGEFLLMCQKGPTLQHNLMLGAFFSEAVDRHNATGERMGLWP